MITASLIGAQSPPLLQIIVSATPAGVAWTLVGAADDGFTWTVPGGQGVGDGQQLTMVDNRAPLNRPVWYTLRTDTSEETSNEIIATFDAPAILVPPGGGAMVLQSLDGQKSVVAGVLAGSLDVQMPVARARYAIPGSRRPVVRYAPTGDREGSLRLLVLADAMAAFEELFESGEPLLWRCTGPVFDLPAVAVVDYGTPSASALTRRHARLWELPYTLIDDPFMDQRLGAFTWDYIDALQVSGVTVIRDGATMEALLAGLTWNQIDALDWSVYA